MSNLSRQLDRPTGAWAPRIAQRLGLLVCAWLVWGGAARAVRPATAQELWEFSPYRVRVWVAPAPHAMLRPGLRDEIARTLAARAEAAFGFAWEIKIEEPAEEFRTEAAVRLEALDVAQLVARAQLTPPKKPRTPPPASGDAARPAGPDTPPDAKPPSEAGEAKPPAAAEVAKTTSEPEVKKVDPTTSSLRELFQEDKLFVIGIVPEAGDWVIRCRELDCRSRTWSTIQERRIPDLGLTAVTAWEVIQAAFRPVARLETAKDKSASWRIRAGGLVVREDSPLFPASDTMWRPYVRMNDRLGEPRTGVVPAVPWTFAVTKSREGTLFNTDVYTGVKNVLLGRVTSRTHRFALQVRPTESKTLLKLRSTDKTAETMSGYDVLAKDPRSDDLQTLGRTDWRGSMEIPATDYPLRVLYLKNGNQLLARLPMIPGLEPTLTADLAGDDRRLQVEGFVAGMQGKIMDLVARRAIVSTRIKRRANEGQIDEATKLLNEFRALPTRDDLAREISQAQVKLTSPNKRVQDRINKLFEDTRKLLDKFVKAGQLRELEAEVAGQAGPPGQEPPGGGAASAPKPPAPAPTPGDGRASGVPTTPP